MNVRTYVRTETTCTIDPSESWTMRNERALPFRVRQILMQGSDCVVSVSGWAILADGTQGVTHRYAQTTLDELPTAIRVRMLASHKDVARAAVLEIEAMQLKVGE